MQRYRAGEFDIMTDFPTDQYSILQDQYPGQAHVAPFLGLYYYVMNQTKPELQDVNVRRGAVDGDQPRGHRSGHSGNRRTAGLWLGPAGHRELSVGEYRPAWADEPYEQRVAEAAS